jgi:hypothetical protein
VSEIILQSIVTPKVRGDGAFERGGFAMVRRERPKSPANRVNKVIIPFAAVDGA